MKIHPFLMFAGDAAKALELYTQTFPGAEVLSLSHHELPDGSEGIERADLSVAGQIIILSDSSVALDFTFTPSSSLFVTCDSVDECRSAFEKLAEGGSVLMPLDDYGFSSLFGWVSDRFGVSWQLLVPRSEPD